MSLDQEVSSIPLSAEQSAVFLSQLLHQLATALGGLTAYCDHYQTDFPSLFSPSLQTRRRKSSPEDGSTEERMEEGGVGGGGGGGGGDHAAGLTSDSPPHIMQWLYSKLRGKDVSTYSFEHIYMYAVSIILLHLWIFYVYRCTISIFIFISIAKCL